LETRDQGLAHMARLDRLAKSPDVAVEYVTLHHFDLSRSGQIDHHLACNGRGPAAHHEDPIRKKCRFADAVGDEDHRLAVDLLDAQQLLTHLVPRDGVERTERLIHQQNARVVNERSTQCRPLPHAAGEHIRQPIGEVVDLRHLEE
jgi:hypothetical protein